MPSKPKNINGYSQAAHLARTQEGQPSVEKHAVKFNWWAPIAWTWLVYQLQLVSSYCLISNMYLFDLKPSDEWCENFANKAVELHGRNTVERRPSYAFFILTQCLYSFKGRSEVRFFFLRYLFSKYKICFVYPATPANFTACFLIIPYWRFQRTPENADSCNHLW